MERIKNKNRGSVAIVSILLISAILIIAVLGMSEAQVSGSKQHYNEYSGENSYYIAEACLEEAIIRIEDDTSFSEGSLGFGDSLCEISVSGGATKEINIDVSYDDYSMSYRAEISIVNNGSANNAQLISWERI